MALLCMARPVGDVEIETQSDWGYSLGTTAWARRDGGDFGSRPHAADGRHRSRRVVIDVEPRRGRVDSCKPSRDVRRFSRVSRVVRRVGVPRRRRSYASAGAILNRIAVPGSRTGRASRDVDGRAIVARARATSIDAVAVARGRPVAVAVARRAARPRTRNNEIRRRARVARRRRIRRDTVYHASRPPSRSRRARASRARTRR